MKEPLEILIALLNAAAGLNEYSNTILTSVTSSNFPPTMAVKQKQTLS